MTHVTKPTHTEHAQSQAVFISHSHHDVTWCVILAQDLRAAGFPVWLDEDSKQWSDSIPANVSAALADARNFVVIVSAHSLQSKWVAHEVDTALHRNLSNGAIDVFIVELEDIKSWPKRLELLSAMPRIPFYGRPYDVALEQLINALRQRQAEVVAPHAVTQTPAATVVCHKAHKGPTLCVTSSHDQRFVASGGGDGSICLWDWNTQRRVRVMRSSIQATDWIRALAWSPDDSHILAAQDNQVARIWNLNSESGEGEMQFPDTGLLDIIWTDSGIGCVTRSGWIGHCSEQVADVSGRIGWTVETQVRAASPLIAARWRPGDLTLAAAAQDGRIVVVDPDTRQTTIASVAWPRNQYVDIRALQWSFDQTQLAAIYANGRVVIWDMNAHSIIYDWNTAQESPRGLYWVGQDGLIAVADSSGVVKLWQIESQHVVEEKHLPHARILDIASDEKHRDVCMALATGEVCFG